MHFNLEHNFKIIVNNRNRVDGEKRFYLNSKPEIYFSYDEKSIYIIK